MVALNENFAPEKPALGSKNRVGNFFGGVTARAGENRPATRNRIGEKRPTLTIIASGRPVWPSRDPLGEAGGWNLYVFVTNNVVNQWDILGLRVDRRSDSRTGSSSGSVDCCGGSPFDSKTDCCENDTIVAKVTIWVCKRKLGGPESKIPKIGPLSHSFVVGEDPSLNPNTDQKYGKQPGGGDGEGGYTGPGYIEREPYSDFSDCEERLVCPADRARMMKEGPTDKKYFMFSPSGNCHGWANCRSS